MSAHAAVSRPPAPLENLTLWQRVYDHLREEILSGRLQPGAELAEVAISEQLGVSRGPLREAIGRLEAEGLVTVRPRRGAVVSSLSKEEFLELYQVREALEMMAVRLAVPRLTAEDVDALQGLIETMAHHAEHDGVTEFFEANAAFHARLLEASGNGKLQTLYRQLLGQMGRYRIRSLILRGNLQRSVAEHAAILRAAKRGDAERAAHLMSEHVRVPQRRLKALSEDELAPAGETAGFPREPPSQKPPAPERPRGAAPAMSVAATGNQMNDGAER
jgi:DNA-binding GntR family transcriptional regulator